nr:ProsH [Phaeosphaeria sp.]
MNEAENPKAFPAGDNATKSQPLRNSCEPCHASKLRCSREKPTCARCTKNGTECTYAPTKRPGRPRKVPAAASSISQGPAAPARHSTRGDKRTESLDTVVSSLAPASAPDDPRDHRPGPSPGRLGFGTPPTQAHVANIADNVEMFDFANAHMLDDASFFYDVLADPLEHTTNIETVRDDNEDLWMLLDAPESQPQHNVQSPFLDPAYWPIDPVKFEDDCASLKHCIAVSHVLGSFTDDSERETLDEHDCLCHTAAANLMFHRKSAKAFRPKPTLEACLHLQRVLDWTWAALKECNGCWDDEMIQFILVGTVKEVVMIHRALLDGITRRSKSEAYHGSVANMGSHSGERRGFGRGRGSYLSHSRHGLERQQFVPMKGPQPTSSAPRPPLFESTALTFGDTAIRECVKTSFLCRLISMKLRHLGGLLGELLSWTPTDLNLGAGSSPVQIHITGVLERINITAGVLAMLE